MPKNKTNRQSANFNGNSAAPPAMQRAFSFSLPKKFDIRALCGILEVKPIDISEVYLRNAQPVFRKRGAPLGASRHNPTENHGANRSPFCCCMNTGECAIQPKETTMKAIMKFMLIACVAALATGCTPKGNILGATNHYDTRPDAEVRMLEEGRMFRAYVDAIATDDDVAEWLANYSYSDEDFRNFWGMTKEEARDKQHIIVTFHSSLGYRARRTFLADKKWNLGIKDIIDFRGRVTQEDWLVARRSVPVEGFVFFGRTAIMPTHNDGGGGVGPRGEPAQIVGIVCRRHEPGCNYNSDVQIGIGRKLASASDYLGPVEEGKGEFYDWGENLSEFLAGIPGCLDCDDDAE